MKSKNGTIDLKKNVAPWVRREASLLSHPLHRRPADLELVQGARARLRRFLGVCLFHVSVSANRLIGAGHTNRDQMRRGRQALGEIRDVGFELGDQAPLELALAAVAERIEQRAAQEF